MDMAGTVARSPFGDRHPVGGFATDADAFAALIICIAIMVAMFEIVRGACDRRRIKVRRKT